MPDNCFTDKLIIFNKNSYFIGDVKSILLADILNPVHKFTCDAFIAQLVGYSYIKSNSKLALIRYLPSGYILRNNFNIFSFEHNLLSVNCYLMSSKSFKNGNLLRRQSSDSVTDFFHQFAISRTKRFKIRFYLLNQN